MHFFRALLAAVAISGCSAPPSECTSDVALLDGGHAIAWSSCSSPGTYDCAAELDAGHGTAVEWMEKCSL
jgi:hypothetical protein